MDLFTLLLGISFEVVHGRLHDMEIQDILFDSRHVVPDTAFVCIHGPNYNSHKDFEQIVRDGARIVFVEEDVETEQDVLILKVKNTRKALSYLCINFFGVPDDKLTVIGVTGTKGKTTTAAMIYKLLMNAGRQCGMIGTFGAVYGNRKIRTRNTTPDPYTLQSVLRDMVQAGMDTVVMEISSVGLLQERVTGIDFDIAVLTNLLPDHQNARNFGDFKDYLKCKRELFFKCSHAVVNGDDRYFREVLEGTSCDVTTYGLTADVDYRADNVSIVSDFDSMGLSYDIYDMKRTHVEIHKLGRVNVYNSLAAYAVMTELGYEITDHVDELDDIVIDGRAEVIRNNTDIAVIVDCARTPTEFEQLFETVEEYRNNRLVAVFGTCGNPDPDARLRMAEIAARYVDACYLTDQRNIHATAPGVLDEMASRLADYPVSYVIEPHRPEAIRRAITEAHKGDIVVIAGKGSELHPERETFDETCNDYDAIYAALDEREKRLNDSKNHH